MRFPTDCQVQKHCCDVFERVQNLLQSLAFPLYSHVSSSEILIRRETARSDLVRRKLRPQLLQPPLYVAKLVAKTQSLEIGIESGGNWYRWKALENANF